MDNKIKAVIGFVSKRTKGVVKLNPADAKELIELCSEKVEDKFHVSVYKFNGQSRGYDPYRTLSVTESKMARIMLKTAHVAEVKEFYKIVIIDCEGKNAGTIYTVNPCLFS